MSPESLVETFLEEGRIDHFDRSLAKKIVPGKVSWLALWVVKAFRQGITIAKIDENLHPCPAAVFVDEQFVVPKSHECEAIEKSIKEEIAFFDSMGIVIDPPFIALSYSYGIERALQRHSRRLLKAAPFIPLSLPRELEAVNDDQRRAIIGACEHTFSLITGGPGTGKTYTAGIYLQHVAKTSPIPLKVALVAPTGRAVQALEKSIGRFVNDSISIQAHTIHSLIRSKEYLPFHLIIVDECSMVDSDLMLSLFERIHSGVRVLMLGDADQLPPIEPGRPFLQLLQELPAYRLQTCQRTNVRDILTLASLVCDGNSEEVREWLSTNSSEEVCFYNCQTSEEWGQFYNIVDEEITAMWKKSSKAAVCLTPIRKGPFGTEAINERVSKELVDQKVEPIVVCKNAHNLRLMNGELGLLEKESGEILFAHGKIPLALCPQIEKAYAMTVHKSQGSEFDTVLFVLPPKAYVDRKLLYTAITRAKKRLIIVADIEDFSNLYKVCI